MVSIKVKIDPKLRDKMNRLAKKFPDKMFREMKFTAQTAHSKAMPRVTGKVLKVQTKWLSSTLKPFIRRRSRDRIDAGIYTMAWYARLHELGLGVKKRPFLKPSVEEAVDKLMKKIELWEE